MEIHIQNRKKGFTLAELLVVVAIVAILAVISISAAVAYFVHRLLGSKKDCNYIECDCEPDCL